MTATCAHESCSCTMAPGDLRQLRCNECGRHTSPFPYGGKWDGEMVDDYVEGCWLTTGVLCPDCAPEA